MPRNLNQPSDTRIPRTYRPPAVDTRPGTIPASTPSTRPSSPDADPRPIPDPRWRADRGAHTTSADRPTHPWVHGSSTNTAVTGSGSNCGVYTNSTRTSATSGIRHHRPRNAGPAAPGIPPRVRRYADRSTPADNPSDLLGAREFVACPDRPTPRPSRRLCSRR